jgi:hypothetical protein
MDRSGIINSIVYTIFALITIYLFVYIHQQVPEPYMDEYFHFHQAANYCSGNYRHVNINYSLIRIKNLFF